MQNNDNHPFHEPKRDYPVMEEPKPSWWLGCGLLLTIVVVIIGLCFIWPHLERWDSIPPEPLPEEISSRDTVFIILVGESDSILEKLEAAGEALYLYCYELAARLEASPAQCDVQRWPIDSTTILQFAN